jgi:OmpA-OmpF porin, OOP family
MSENIKIILGVLTALLTAYLCARCQHSMPIAAAPVAAAGPRLPASVGIEYGADKVTVSGRVPDEATRARLIGKANELHGADRVVDALTIDATAEKCAWLGADRQFATLLPRAVKRATLDCATLTLEGEVESGAVREQIGAEALAAAGAGVTLDNRLTVRAAAVQQQIAKVLELKNIEFETSKSVITPAGKATLDEVYGALAASPNTRFEIGGHTDSRGNAAANQALSQARAEAVLAYLTSRGLEAGRFTTRGYGADKPVADNGSSAGRARNRRIEFVQIGG